MGVRSHSSGKQTYFAIGVIVFVGIGSKVCGKSASLEHADSHIQDVDQEERNAYNAPGNGMRDSVFDFNFKWDEEPPEFISQLDLEVKWEDGSSGEPSKVSIYNVTMDEDITGPMTQLITSIANSSFHEMPKWDNYTEPQVLKGEKGTRGKRGRRGIKGDRGIPGLSIVGPKGEPGNPGYLPHHLLFPETSMLKGDKGSRGYPGIPGTCSTPCQSSNQMAGDETKTPKKGCITIADSKDETAHKPSYRIVPGALVFKTVPSMLKMSNFMMLGTVAFVEESEEFYGKVKKGWRQFQMGPLLP